MKPWPIIAAVVLAARATSAAPAPPRAVAPLFSEAEAAKLRLTDAQWLAEMKSRRQGARRSRKLDAGAPLVPRGPTVRLVRPELAKDEAGDYIPLTTPADLELAFDAADAAVDMSSLRVRWEKTRLLGKDVTDKLAPFVKADRLVVEDVAVPAGKYRVRLGISDAQGNLTEWVMRVRVAAAPSN